MIQYLIELSIVHSILILGYYLFLRDESQYNKMRSYLIGSTALSILIPLVRLPSIQSLFESETQTIAVYLNPVGAIPFAKVQETTNAYDLIYWIYALVCLWFLFHIIKAFIYLVRLESNSELEKVNEIVIRKVPNLEGTFSFFNWIFVNKQIEESEADYIPIIHHEHAHSKLGHTYDLLFFQLFRAAFWWLPSVWFINKEIKKIHEYQADAYTLKSYSIDQYSSILISSTLKSNGMSLASSFHDALWL